MTQRFALLPADQPPAELEEQLLARWREEKLFAQSIDERKGGPSFVFFEGPPTANGRPGIHHVFARTIKDLFCRHRAMKGFRVERKAGWDTHGLPVEIEVEKKLGISGKQDIEKFGVVKFNELCRESVFTYRSEWEEISQRIGYWLDYEHPYVTYDNDYIESVWWSLATLYAKGLIYRGHKILPYCSRCGTSLSSHEVAQGWQDVEDPSVYIALELTSGAEGRRILVWTTTPWTLVSNTALAVKPELTYVELVKTGSPDARTIIMAESRAHAVLGDDYESRWTKVGSMKGADLVGTTYRRPLDWLEYPEGTNHEVIVGEDFVLDSDGSGVVHMSPAFGADDYAAGRRHNLAFLLPVNGRGEFDENIPLVGGMFVKKADPLLIEELERRRVLWKAGKMIHPYPHCWRCGTPLLYYARNSWFVRTSAFKDDMVARNASINWNPADLGTGRMGEWLQNNIDWAVSRDRYWGTPLPIWECDRDAEHLDVVGSFADLASRSGTVLGENFDPHKPFVDDYEWACTRQDCGGHMHRTPEVIDAWYDSGSMPFAQWHYPFENRETVAAQFPADFIAEGQDQTRGWFYTLLAISTGLGDELPNNAAGSAAPYQAVVVNGIVTDAEGKKMSKSRGNIVLPADVIARHGADAARLFLVSSSSIWETRRFDENAIRQGAGRFLRTLKNIYTGMFANLANFGWSPSNADPAIADRPLMDRWVLSRLASVEVAADDALQRFDATMAARIVMEFVDEDVANWYVRQTRSRLWAKDNVFTDDTNAAFATLHEVLVVVTRLLAPFAPFVTDWMHRELTGTSVHLASYTRKGGSADSSTSLGMTRGALGATDVRLEEAMATMRTLATLGRAAREQVGINVRQPLSRMVCVAPGVDQALLEELLPVLRAELNVKQVDFASSGDALVTLEAKPNFRALGKKFGKKTPLAAEAVKAFTGEHLRAFQSGAELALTVEGETHLLEPDDVTILSRASGSLVVEHQGALFAAIDPTLTPELEREGMARELISRVQRMRKDTGLAVSDRIELSIGGDVAVVEAAEAHREWIADEVLATHVAIGEERPRSTHMPERQQVDIDGVHAELALTRDE